MNLENEIVIHKVFGEGKVLNLDGDKLTVAFILGEKKFIFPDAFKGFLMASWRIFVAHNRRKYYEIYSCFHSII